MATAYVSFWAGVKDGLHHGFISNTDIVFTGGEADATVPGTAAGGDVVAEIYVDADCHWICEDADNNATDSDKFLANGERMSYWVTPGRDISFISDS